MTRNMIKVFGFSEEFTPKQQILQHFTNLIQYEEKNSVMVVCDKTARSLLFFFEKLMHTKVPSTRATINEGILKSRQRKGVL